MLKKHPLISFISLYLLIWIGLTLLIHSQTSISPDTAENIIWGQFPSLMYDKHPGLGALFLLLLTSIFPPLLSQVLASAICIVITWIYTYKLVRIYYPKNESVFITILSTLSFFYMGEYFLQYNQNTILLPFWTGTAYFFVKSLRDNNTISWIFLGIFSALGIYAKFQIGLLLIIAFAILVLNYKSKYTKNLVISFLAFMIIIIPGIISLADNNFETILYVTTRSFSSSNILSNILLAIGDTLLQILNFIVPIAIVSFLIKKRKISQTLRGSDNYIIYLGLAPFLIFSLLEMIKGHLPTEWLLPITALFVPAIYSLFRLKTNNINFKKIIILGTCVNLAYFIGLNMVSFSNNNLENSNFGDSIAIAATKFINDKHIDTPLYTSSLDWKSGYYLTIFMPNKPIYIRDISKVKDLKQPILVSAPNCNNLIDKNNIIAANYTIINEECVNIKPVDKFHSKEKPYTFYLIKRN